MVETPKDIYGAREPDRRTVEERRGDEQLHPWTQKVFSNRLTIAVFIVVLLGFFAILAVVIVVQQRQLIESRKGNPTVDSPLNMAPPPRIGMEMQIDSSGRLVLDEIEPQVSPDEAGTSPTVLTPKWVMQAAFNLRQAQRAYSEQNWSEALADYTAALKILPAISGVRESMGLCHLRLQNYPDAELLFAEATQAQPKVPGLLNNLGVALLGQGKQPEAEARFREAIEIEPVYLPARQNLALLYYRMNRFDQAREAYDAVLRLDPRNADATLMFVAVLMRLEQWAQAAEVLTDYTKANPQNPPAFFRLAEVSARAGNRKGALEALNSALELVDVRTAMLWMNRKEFDVLRDDPEFQKKVAELTEVLK